MEQENVTEMNLSYHITTILNIFYPGQNESARNLYTGYL